MARVSDFVNADRLWARHMAIAEHGKTGNGGVNRQALTDHDRAVRAELAGWAHARGFEVLIDEDTDEDGEALGRTSMDAPEVDPRVLVEAEGLTAGDRVRVRVTEVTEEFDLVGELA